ncbi:MAG: carboxypeptidase regulatory-like domain-containing protein [Candidatus Solibacter sp.]
MCSKICQRFFTILCLHYICSGVPTVLAQSNSSITGRVVDATGRAISGAVVTVRHQATKVERSAATNREGIYELQALPVGSYSLQMRAIGFRLFTVQSLTTEVARITVQDGRLEVGEFTQQVTVEAERASIDAATTSVGHVIDGRTVQELPLNGRYFLDLALLAPGSVTPNQSGFSVAPSRGLGAQAINTAGNREEAVNYMINGITLNDQLFSSILFQPSIGTLSEFKIDNSTLSAEYGHSSGAIVNMATRSGASEFHGELFEFLRNDALDARNFFTQTSSQPSPFRRNQFGVNVGGPLVRGKTFFFLSYEGVRQEQDLDLNSLVLSDAQRSAASSTAIAKLVELIPRANLIDSSGTPRFVGTTEAPVRGDQWAADISHSLGKTDRLHGYYSFYNTTTVEPTQRGNTVPGFGHIQHPVRQFFSLNQTHTFGGNRLNEARFGVNRLSSTTEPNAKYNPVDFGIRDGITQAIGLPQISVAGGALNFGGPSPFPSGRGDTTFVAGDTASCLCGRHSLKIGGEYRQFLNNNFRRGTGAFNFPSVAAFLAGEANSFSLTLPGVSSAIAQGAAGFFVQDHYKLPYLTIDAGLRYDWNMTPTERYGRFVVFDPRTASLVRVGPTGRIYHQNNKNFQPRLGFAWDPFRNGKTSVRGAYAVFVDQPLTNVVAGTAGNPPLATPLTYTGAIRLDNAIDLAQAAGVAPVTVDHGFSNAYLQSWNINVQREIPGGVAAMVGYFGSKATHLTLLRNINQPVNGQRPFVAISPTSAILPGTPLGNISQTESTGNSSYNALWLSTSKRPARGLQIKASYTWSKSLDYNSLSSQGIVLQDSYDLRNSRGLSDFDVRHRVAAMAIYDLPFHGNPFITGWQIALVLQAQSGNPVNIVTGNSTVNGVANTLRPDVAGPVATIGSVDRWFDTAVFTAVPRFGSLGRNVVIGPGFNNSDFSILKDTHTGDRVRIQFRAEFFDLFNHANLGQPGNVVGSPGLGRITNTRFPGGESGSSRQIQLGIKVML